MFVFSIRSVFARRPPARTALWCVMASAAVLAAGPATPSVSDDALKTALWRLERLPSDPLSPSPPPAAPVADEVRDRRYLAIARSVRTVQTGLDSVRAVLTGEVLPLLSVARNLDHLGLHRRALDWYEKAELADKDHGFSDMIRREINDVALEIGDSTLLVAQAEEFLALEDAARWSMQLGRILARLEDRPLGSYLEQLVDRIDALGPGQAASTLFILARYRQRQGRHADAEALYQRLLNRQKELDDRQLALTLRGLADAALAGGRERRARALYRRYREHDTGFLSAWSTYQLAGLAASEGDYEDAIDLFRSICEREGRLPFRETACQRLAQVKEIEDIEDQLEAFGRDLQGGEGSR